MKARLKKLREWLLVILFVGIAKAIGFIIELFHILTSSKP